MVYTFNDKVFHRIQEICCNGLHYSLPSELVVFVGHSNDNLHGFMYNGLVGLVIRGC